MEPLVLVEILGVHCEIRFRVILDSLKFLMEEQTAATMGESWPIFQKTHASSQSVHIPVLHMP